VRLLRGRHGVAHPGLTRLDRISHAGTILCFGALLVYAVIVAISGHQDPPRLWLCPWLTMTGTPCPWCGIVRSVAAGFLGDWQASLRFHPLGWAIFSVTLWLAARCAAGLWKREPFSLGRGGSLSLLAFGIACWAGKLITA